MAKSYQRTLFIGLLTLAPLFGACEQVDISGVTEVPAPTLALKTKQAKIITRAWSSMPGTVMSDWVTAGKSTTLKIGKYELWIPKGAVKKPTTFRMTVLAGPVIGVSLEAIDNKGDAVTHFQVPLRLTLPYDEAASEDIQDPTKLMLANIASETNPTILEVVNAAVDWRHQTITGSISHFSVWSVAVQLSKELSPGID